MSVRRTPAGADLMVLERVRRDTLTPAEESVSRVQWWAEAPGRSAAIASTVVVGVGWAVLLCILPLLRGPLEVRLDQELSDAAAQKVTALDQGGSPDELVVPEQQLDHVWIGTVASGPIAASTGPVVPLGALTPTEIGGLTTDRVMSIRDLSDGVEVTPVDFRIATREAEGDRFVLVAADIKDLDNAMLDRARAGLAGILILAGLLGLAIWTLLRRRPAN